eukprot:TRINITY_DN1822_c0_g1_i1.p1 TRINITY_DN1822_c0_g1~~TRINITY_DN1822_c0_g1_i1.p1  ORF type:complete len:150 (+),score=33.73 TRINITY_DN1822_c0_g1_i1:47-496(+)
MNITNSTDSIHVKLKYDSFYETFMGFVHAIDWSESWIHVLLSLHVILFTLILFTRRQVSFQSFLLILILGCVYMAETINTYCAENWRSFSTQNYFDKNGIFISTLYSAPLLISATTILLNLLYNSAQLLVEVKKMQFKQEARKRDKKDK